MAMKLLFLLIIYQFCEVLCNDYRSSLAFVIDDTGSMMNDIEQVKTRVNEIFDELLKTKESQIKNVVLVTFNDPGYRFSRDVSYNTTVIQLRTITQDRDVFRRALNNITVDYGGDCPEYSLSGIEKAIKVSEPGSYIYVFTDASAKDYTIHDEVKSLAQEKSCQITFVLTGKCSSYLDPAYMVYVTLANATNGQVIISEKGNVAKVVDVITEGNKGKNSLVTSQVIPEGKRVNVTFNVDETMKKLMITTSGLETSMKVYLPYYNIKSKRLLWTSNTKVVELTNLVPGPYVAEVYGSSTTFFRVTAKTNFIFQHGFSTSKPKKLSDTISQPIADEENYLSVLVNDPNDEIEIQTAKITDTNENVLIELPLKKVDGHFYGTNKFISPNHTIKIAVTGIIKENGQSVQRFAKIPVEPKIVTRRPVIDKSSQNKIVGAGSETVKILCKILDAKPKPKISWSYKSSSSLSFVSVPGNDEELTVHITGPSQAGRYKCIAENSAGQDTHVTELVVTFKPKVTIGEGTNISVKYGSTVRVTCNVNAVPAPIIEWRDKNDRIFPADAQDRKNFMGNTNLLYSNTLTLKNVKKSTQYSCYASNTHGTTVSKINLTVLSPFSGPEKETLDLEYGKSYSLLCKVKSEFPVNIQWYFTRENSKNTEALKPSAKYHTSPDRRSLIINAMDLDLRGKYTCKVSLASDKNEKKSYDVELKIRDLMAPHLQKSTTPLIVREKRRVSIPCKIIKGVPKPTVKWYFKNKQSNKFESVEQTGEELHIKSAALENAGFYKCVASNQLGRDEVVSELVVQAPARIINKIKEFHGVIGDIAMRIPCDVTGYPKPIITWTVQGKPIVQDKKYVIDNGALIIKNPTNADSSEYTCKAKNEFGSDTKTFTGIVSDFTDYDRVRRTYYILEGETKKIECPVPYKATDSIRWFMNGYDKNITGPYIEFVDATALMDGNYTCRVSNNLGTNYDTSLVDVGFPPRFLINGNLDISNWDGEDDMNCDVESKPYATSEWRYNGKPVALDKHATRLDISGWGEYTCRVTNVHGVVERTFSVSSEVCLINRYVTNAPVILSESSTWPEFEVKMNYTVIDSGVNLKFYCSNKSGAFRKFPGKQEIVVTCDHEDNFSYEGKLYKYSDLDCNKPVEPTLVKTGRRCLNDADNTETIRVGFGKTFLEAYEVCFDKNNNVPLYTHLTMRDSKYLGNRNGLKWSRYPEIGIGNQEKVYSCVNDRSCCYAKSQMVNASDINYVPMQISTYVEQLNAVPVWLPCTERTTWSQVEDAIKFRFLVDSSPLSVWTGASNYMVKNGGKIPKYLWKVVKSSDGVAMAVVYVNEETPKDEDILCKNICNGEGFLYLNPKDKFTYCCELDDFVRGLRLPKNIFV